MKFNIPKTWLSSKAHLEEGKNIEAGRNPATMNLQDRPTPETDDIGIDHLTATEQDYKLRKLARRLERQRDAAVEALEWALRSLDYYGGPLLTHLGPCGPESGCDASCMEVSNFGRNYSEARATLADIKGDKL